MKDVHELESYGRSEGGRTTNTIELRANDCAH